MTAFTDLEAMLADVRNHARANPAADFLWSDDPLSRTHRLVSGTRSWEITAHDAALCRNELLVKALRDPRGKANIITAIMAARHAPSPRQRRYGNARPWDRIRDPDDTEPIPHVHACPLCYEHTPCSNPRCTLEPDLELRDGTPAGSHSICPACEAREQRREHDLGA